MPSEIENRGTMLPEVIFMVAIVTGASGFQDRCLLGNSWKWQPKWMPPRDDLYCHNSCDSQGGLISDSEVDECCTCNSCSHWPTPTLDLVIEYVSATGKSLVLSDEPFDNASSYQIVHTWQEMTEIPSNLCYWESDDKMNASYPNEMLDMKTYWDNVVLINFQGNKIRQMLNLNCLTRLDTLDMRGNKITYVTNTSIDQLSHLRNLDLSGNSIKAMDPGVLFSPMINLLIVDLTFNNLQQLDVTNAFLKKPFCSIDYSYNDLTEIINLLGFELDKAQKYGPGMVTLANNAFEVFPDLKTLFHFDDLNEWGQLMSWGFDFRNIQLNCNCYMEPFMSLAENIRSALWRDYFNITCVTPPELAGQTAVYVDQLKLVCSLDQKDNCPRGCTCIDQPKTNTLYVDCSFTNLETLPEHLPTSNLSDYISLNVSHNLITTLETRSYFSKITHLDVSHNFVNQISEECATSLEAAVLDLSFNTRLRKIPQNFQYRKVCVTKMDENILDCDCDNLWIETWVQTKFSKDCALETQLFRCDIRDKGVVSVLEFNSSMIVCLPDNYVLYLIVSIILGVLVVLIVTGVLAYIFRYEILITWTRIRQTSLEIHIPMFKYDVLISLNEEDEKLRLWIRDNLLPILKLNGYKTFIPYMDIGYGGDRDSDIAETMRESRTFLLILSESYLKEPDKDSSNDRLWTENEWKYGWNNFRENKDHNLVIINYDYISASDLKHRQIKAFLRVGHVVNFGNHDMTVLADIRKKIGAPRPEIQRNIRYLENYNVKFRPECINQSNDASKDGIHKSKPYLIQVSPMAEENCNVRFRTPKPPTFPPIKMPFNKLPATADFPEPSQVLHSRSLQEELNTDPFHADIESVELGLPPVFTKLKKPPESPAVDNKMSTPSVLAQKDTCESQLTDKSDVKCNKTSNNSRPMTGKKFAKVAQLEEARHQTAKRDAKSNSSPNNSRPSSAQKFAKVAPIDNGREMTSDLDGAPEAQGQTRVQRPWQNRKTIDNLFLNES